MTSGDSRGRFSEHAPRSLEESYSLFENFTDGGQSLSAPENAGRCYRQSSSPLSFGLFPSKFCESIISDRYACESLNCVGTSHDAVGGYREFDGGYDDPHPATWTGGVPSGWPLPCSMLSGGSRSPFSDSGRSQYSSFSDLSGRSASSASSYTRPAPIGSRSRGAAAYVQCHYGGRGGEAAVSCRGVLCSDVAAQGFRGTKRKMKVPGPQGKFVKKQRIVRASPATAGLNEVGHIPCDGRHMDKEDVEGRVRITEKRRRRREKNRERYGDKYRMAFTCAFCKFRTFEDKDIETHFGSTHHRETLDYIRRQTKFDDRVISFLHDCMVQKFRKTVSALCKLRTLSDQKTNQKLMEGVTEEDYMRKVEVVHCMACDTHIPAVSASVRHHLNSSVHLKSRVVYKEQLKRESVLTAKAIINNDSVKVRYEKYIKGENPFVTDAREETSSDSSEQERPGEDEEENVD